MGPPSYSLGKLWELLVFSLTYKEFVSSHSIITMSKKLNKWKKQQLFLDLSEMQGHRQTATPKIGYTNRQIQRSKIYQNRNTQAESSVETGIRIVVVV